MEVLVNPSITSTSHICNNLGINPALCHILIPSFNSSIYLCPRSSFYHADNFINSEMGGGTSIWASPEWKSDPKEIFNWKLWYLTTTVAFAGCSYGFDQGNIGGVLTLPSFKRAFGLDVLSETEADERGMCTSKGW